MTTLRTLIVLSVAAFAMAVAGPGVAAAKSAGSDEEHVNHQPEGDNVAPMATMESHMRSMQEMHDKMMGAMTPEERDALKAEHETDMPRCMGMGKGMSGMGGKGHIGRWYGTGANEPDGMPGEAMAERYRMLEHRIDMMEMMLQMIMDRLPPQPRAQGKK